ncbi:hypothetical protein [Paraburkholderia caballeronis]|uniref:Lipoprotein n=1 Tax=Paraburkholderia caballeronis TaxID=416943 RepID=A0A1H7VH33_9BURK|nr:hypothetical protein [Paraburkholderia caballeronis]PXW16053.1 hypothetical protein C7403_12449 [Paraburkholderia caballeronis]PXW93955.1 hypothetical protein C7407_12449 [Paraburkholderia caballeronis]RAJ89084.1 hypothetical protein C7409_12449 [Paraburkholderia caballeronis]TDV09266.1 hypothetical protein C7408_11688 [Paraburkholderia caballeronis]TDV12326.1 hypothetical protein C7406_11788 [Paraburkholderia caballeronis]
MTRIRSLLIRHRSTSLAAGACALLAALSACSSGPPLFLSDGRPTQQVQCPASGDRDSCVQQARARCGEGGYDTVDQLNNNGVYTLVFACRAH